MIEKCLLKSKSRLLFLFVSYALELQREKQAGSKLVLRSNKSLQEPL